MARRPKQRTIQPDVFSDKVQVAPVEREEMSRKYLSKAARFYRHLAQYLDTGSEASLRALEKLAPDLDDLYVEEVAESLL